MFARVKEFGGRSFERAMDQNLAAICTLLARDVYPSILDLGCHDGERTLQFAQAASATEVHGVEIVPEFAAQAASRGIDVKSFDLCEPWPYADASFDAVCSNQVIEHLRDTDVFVAEAMRCLRPGGVTVVSTENLASWHNIGSLLFGWQPFSLTNVSSTAAGVGNPLALHVGESPEGGSSWQHMRVFAYAGLRDLYSGHGFSVTAVVGSGYYPLPRAIARIDPRHAAFLALAGTKPAMGI